MPVTDLRFAFEQEGRSTIVNFWRWQKSLQAFKVTEICRPLPWGSQGSYNVLSPYVVYVLANTPCVMTLSGGTDILTPQETTRFATIILCDG